MDTLQAGRAGDAGVAASHRDNTGTRPRPAYLEKGDVFRTLGLSDELTIGLDAMALTTNKSLQGFREIPPGAHFLWIQQPGSVSRCGCWFISGSEGLLRVKEWDKYNEMLGEPAEPSEDARSQPDRVESLYPTLKPYMLHDHRSKSWTPLDNKDPLWARSPSSLWGVLTNAITPRALARVTRRQNVQEYIIDSTDGAHSSTNNGLNFLFAQDLYDLQVLDQGSLKDRVADTSGRIRTLLATAAGDKTNNGLTERDIVAELQFTFLTGTHLSNSACLEQWWNLVLKIVLRAYDLATSHPRLVADLLTVLYAQLFYTEHYVASSSSSQQPDVHSDAADGDVDDDHRGGKKKRHGPSSDRAIFQYKPLYRGKLRQALAEYKRRLGNLAASPDHEAVGQAFEELEAWLWRKGWDLRGESSDSTRAAAIVGGGFLPADSEDEEDEQPVVVELDEEGREAGLLSFRD
ncbi:AAR2 protein-domain-containing protein [Corynascus similis CBS 632.67]